MHGHDHDDDLSRRSFLKALGASVALAGLDGCTRMPAEKILPYVNEPPEFTPGIAVHYATSMVLDGYATGLIAETHEGRPTKIEGNPDHPASLGSSGMLEQASLLQLYDPDRGARIRNGATASTWQAFAAAFAPSAMRARTGARGAGLALLLEPTSSPLVASQLTALRVLYPDMRVFFHAPLQSTSIDAAFGTPGVVPQYDVRAAEVILSAASDFLAAGPFNLRYARAFADSRRTPAANMNRLYVAETTYSVTGGAADHRLACTPAMLEAMLQSVLAAVHSRSAGADWASVVADDLAAHSGRSLVIAGERQPPRVHALTAAINDALGNTGRTVWFARSPLLAAGDSTATIEALAQALNAGTIDTLLCVGGNPAYATPGSMRFADMLRRVPNSAYVGLYENETARTTRWFVPAAHYLETWGDARAYDGTYSLVQPLLQPLHGGKSAVEVLAAVAGQPALDVRAALHTVALANGVAPGEDAWNAALGRGFVDGTPLTRVSMSPRLETVSPAANAAPARDSVVVVIGSDSRVHDGSFANNGWLQELPDPITKLTWGNAALLSSATAARIGASTGDEIELSHGGSSLRIPALVVPGHADDAVTLHMGYGRAGAEHVADGVGVNVDALMPAPGAFVLPDIAIRRAEDGGHHALAITQAHWSMEGRGQARSETLAAFHDGGSTPKTPARRSLTIYDPPPRLDAPQQWAMTIDLGTCIGCSACVVACQAENNIPVVGPEDVAKSREMQWLRIDRYVERDGHDVRTIAQPMLCQHCENAPCEYVCPVGATTHSADGLNEMVYKRCVGTRFCSNNCPYKVRRFNWYDYNARLSDTEQMGKNPDVTVRERGVMEKCTFCVQRIREAEIAAGVDGRPLRGSDVKTACQQSCPTNAIVFGSLTEAESPVVQQRRDGRAYSVLDELGTAPRVQYLARIRNVNPRLAPPSEPRG
ncbi:MAG TPA: 4Fe-4S dicluster domain-containing protein [Gemmatimonadaceae bacterium]|nr:4Fe-4S dicluster domain-containing protein [Gemmatimonadaceae bacterium]